MKVRIATLMIATAALAGCGSGGARTGSLALTAQQPTLKQVQPADGGAVPVPPPAKKARHASKARGGSAKDTGKKVSAAKRAEIAAGVAEVIAKALGFKAADATVSGKIATVAVPADAACGGGTTGATTLHDRLATGVPFTTKVLVVVKETRAPLAGYVAAHCKPATPPLAAGRLVLEQKGTGGVVDTKTFEIRSGSWTVSYANDGGFMQAFVLKGGKIQPVTFTLDKPGRGKKRFEGPGRFSLRVAGAGTWTIQVRDG
jgi:hypothetical protein